MICDFLILKSLKIFYVMNTFLPEQVWVCYGEQNYGKVCYVNCEDSVVMDLGIEVFKQMKYKFINIFKKYLAHIRYNSDDVMPVILPSTIYTSQESHQFMQPQVLRLTSCYFLMLLY